MDNERPPSSNVIRLAFLEGGGVTGKMLREHDWSQTPLGPPQDWPQSLKTCVRIMLDSRQPIWIGWGKELIKFYNDPYLDIIGGKHPWALCKPAATVWSDIWGDIAPMLEQVMERGQGTYVESQLLIMERNGYPEETYYTFSYTPIPGDDGSIAGMFCANTDDTDRIISERQLRTLTGLGKSLIDSRTPDEVTRVSMEILGRNRHDFPFALLYSLQGSATAALTESTPLGEAAVRVPASISLGEASEPATLISTAIRTGSPQVLEGLTQKLGLMPTGAWALPPDQAIIVPLKNAPETFGVLVVGLNPHRLLDEKYRSFFSLVADQISTALTDVHAQEKERERAAALAEIDRAKTAFFTNISHEFRTPLTLMLGSVESLLQRTASTDDGYDALDTAHRNAMRLLRLVNNLLDFSRLEAGRFQASYQLTDIAAFTSSLASGFQSAIEAAGMQFRVSCRPVPDPVYVDRSMWEKVVLNLLSNAFKYTLQGRIELALSAADRHVVLTVSDTGVGIPEEELPRMFERFHRIQNTGRTIEGTGIGLSLVKELVGLHGGTIDVSSVQGQGSVFTVTIPIGKWHLPQDQIPEFSPEAADWQQAAFIEEAAVLQAQSRSVDDVVPAPSNDQITVLIVDDNTDMRRYIAGLLQPYYHVLAASDGLEALELLGSKRPDLVISDIMMPRMNGIELLKTIKASPRTASLPVILLSARAGEEARLEGLETGADDYLVKPFSARELLARVQAQLGLVRQRGELQQRLQNLVRQAPVGMAVFRGDQFEIELANDRQLEIWGKTAREVLNKPAFEALAEASGQGIEELFRGVYRTGEPFIGHAIPAELLRHGRRELGYYNFTLEALREDDGTISGIVSVSTEVTQQILYQKQLEESEKRFRTLAEALPHLIWMQDASGKIEYASGSWKKYSGIEDSEEAWEWMVHPEDRVLMGEGWANSFSSGQPFRHELRLRDRHGRYRWFYSVVEPVKDSEDKLLKWVGALTDINTQKTFAEALERQVADRTHELQRSNEDLQQFAHVASHDLKEPVRKVLTFAGMLESSDGASLSAAGRLSLDKVHHSAERMMSMVNGILAYSKLSEAGASFGPVDLDAVMRNVEIDLEVLIRQKEAVIQAELLLPVYGAPLLIHQLFYNLVNNALKFSRKDVSPNITIRSVRDADGTTHISVADNGIGFEQQYAERIFKTFTRLNSKDSYEGTGLGLSLCRKIVERHGGTIRAESTPGQGATFIISLPPAPHAAAKVPTDQSA